MKTIKIKLADLSECQIINALLEHKANRFIELATIYKKTEKRLRKFLCTHNKEIPLFFTHDDYFFYLFYSTFKSAKTGRIVEICEYHKIARCHGKFKEFDYNLHRL